MKLIEKMAKDYEDNRGPMECLCTAGDGELCDRCCPSDKIMHGTYMAGFRAAREMAIEISHNYAHNPLCKTKKCDAFNEACDAVHEISSLGESEVTENTTND